MDDPIQYCYLTKIVVFLFCRIGDLKRQKMVRTINIYYNNRSVQVSHPFSSKNSLNYLMSIFLIFTDLDKPEIFTHNISIKIYCDI